MNNLFKIAAMACMVTLGFTACEKDDKNPEKQEYQAKVMVKSGETKNLADVSTTDNTEGMISRSGDVYSLRNFRQFTIDDSDLPTTTAANSYYIDLKENDGTNETDAALTMNATQRDMDIIANASKGYTLSYIDKAFETVAATDEFIALEDNKLGILTPFSPEGSIGWANYDMSVHHILAIEGRTLILSKDDEALFKFRVNSIYSDETPNKESASDNYVYYSIDYQEFK